MDFQLSRSTLMPASSIQLPGEIGSIPIAILVMTIVIVLYYFLVFTNTGGGGIGDTNNITDVSALQVLVWLIFVFLIIINGANYMLNTDLYVNVKNVFFGKPEVNVVQVRNPNQRQTVRRMLQQKEVFNIPDNKYTYENAKAVCKAHGAKLASYQDIESAYKSGAEWGQYGWSDGQNAYFPTQQSTYDKMQKTPGHENDRGRPGVNGGFIDNPNVQFGVNCYGKKPKINTESATYMADIQPFPKTKEEKKFDKQVEFWKKRTPDMIIAPFNAGQYSK